MVTLIEVLNMVGVSGLIVCADAPVVFLDKAADF